MKEQELSEALHDVMVRSSPPPSMDPASALERGRRARTRRTAVVTGAAVATLVVSIGVAPALVAHYAAGRPTGPMVAGATGTTPSMATPRPVATATPQAPKTRKSTDPWPEGQVDRTATAGPRADRAVNLMQELSAAVPAGFSTPNLKYDDGRPMRWPQAQYASNDGEQDYWEYQAIIPVQKNGRVGQLLALSTTPDGKPAVAPCKLAQRFWGGTGTCTVLDVNGKKVGVLTTNGNDSYDQWAAYRHPDGTVVFLAQSKKTDGRSPLTSPVFTPSQLAELATSPKLKIST
ncbi:hypothetical protein [Kribbella sp. NPDC004875]|uniref:hypothetical protein n=1 Tax=Kribbella sp. NPDC004875 TaxID=3364107 RepID=UPI0036BB4A7F